MTELSMKGVKWVLLMATMLLGIETICAQEQELMEVKSHVVDARTGEILPFVNIFVAGGKGTLTNMEGDFTIKVKTKSSLRFSYVGYETLTLPTEKIGSVVKMKPMTRTLSEVSVKPWESILLNVCKKLDKEYNKRWRKSSRYFYRMTTAYRKKTLVEAFMEARSAVNLHEIKFLKGRHGRMTQEGLSNPFIANMNFHHPLELGLVMKENSFWGGLITPASLSTVKELTSVYDISVEELKGSDGNTLYKFNLKDKYSSSTQKGPSSTQRKRRFCSLTGALYVDAQSLNVLKIEGQVENMYLDIFKDFYKETTPLLLNVTINYNYEKGFAEVQNIAYKATNGDMVSTAILYNVEDLNLELNEKKKKKTKQTGENMLAAIDNAGFDQMLWEHSNIVQRTKEEERLAGLPDQTMLVNDSIKEDPSTPTEKLLDHLKRFGHNLPQEKVYVHMDNTCYFLGDTIWFSAYTTQTNDSKPSQISGVLYVELFNHDGYLVERKLVEMTHGRGYGNFVLDKDAYAGYYELRAYTRWQLNWGMFEREHSDECEEWFYTRELEHNYFRDYDKLYSRVFPVYDKPAEGGDYKTTMTRRTMRQRFKRDPHKREPVLTLYPEGGELVEGLPCRVAYEATWDDGQELEGMLKGKKVENRGRGSFELTPTEKGKDKIVVFTTTDGIQVKAPLPEAAKSGVALRVDVEADSIDITVRRTADLQNDTLGLTLMHEGIIETYINLEGLEQHIHVAKKALKMGVNQATVFNNKGRVLADRLFFVKHSEDTRSQIAIGGMKEMYNPYEPITLNLKTQGQTGGSMSISVRDASHCDVLYDNASLLTELLLTSEIKGFVPNPEFFFEKDDNRHNRALDLLMLTQGWRRFKWTDMANKGAWQLTQVAERTPVITGKVYKTSDAMYAALGGMTWYNDEGEENQHKDTDPFSDQQTQPTRSTESTYNHWQGNMQELLDASSPKTHELTDMEFYPGDNYGPFKNKGMRVHSEIVSPDQSYVKSIDLDTKDGYFKVQLPRYYGDCYFFLSAADTLKWKRKKYEWIQLMSDMEFAEHPKLRRLKVLPPDYHVRVNFPYPRFVKPYSYYQTHLNYADDPLLATQVLNDGSLRIDEVTVWSKHNTLQRMYDSIPALIVDSYEGFNQALDAGLGIGASEVARAYVGDYGLKHPYVTSEEGFHDYRLRVRYGYNITRRAISNVTNDPDSAYLRKNLHSFAPGTYHVSDQEMLDYIDNTHIHKYVLYTDFEPRLAGHERYYGSNLPITQIAIYPFPDDSRRLFYRDRRYILPGFSYVHEFYQPNYAKRKLDEHPKDYRRTLYWNPFLVLDDKGAAQIQFYNNSTRHSISIDAQGFGMDGTPLSGKK